MGIKGLRRGSELQCRLQLQPWTSKPPSDRRLWPSPHAVAPATSSSAPASTPPSAIGASATRESKPESPKWESAATIGLKRCTSLEISTRRDAFKYNSAMKPETSTGGVPILRNEAPSTHKIPVNLDPFYLADESDESDESDEGGEGGEGGEGPCDCASRYNLTIGQEDCNTITLLSQIEDHRFPVQCPCTESSMGSCVAECDCLCEDRTEGAPRDPENNDEREEEGANEEPSANVLSSEAAPAEGSPFDAGIRRLVLPEQTSAALRSEGQIPGEREARGGRTRGQILLVVIDFEYICEDEVVDLWCVSSYLSRQESPPFPPSSTRLVCLDTHSSIPRRCSTSPPTLLAFTPEMDENQKTNSEAEELADDYFEREEEEEDAEEELEGGAFGFNPGYVDEAMSLEELSALISEASKRKPKRAKRGDEDAPNGRYEDPNEPLRCEGYQAPAKKDQNEISDLLAKSVFLTKANLQKELEELQLNTGGTSQQMRDRLKRRLRKDLLSTREYEDEFSRNKLRQHFDFLVIIDFECTCEDEVVDYPFEIIEFPAVLVDTHQKKIVSRFRTFVRPKVNPVLSAFCVELTGVTQADVDKAPRFSEAVLKFHRWLFSHVYPSGQHDFGGLMKSYAIVTDGPWDLGKFFQLECIRSERYNAKIPHHFRAYINIRRVFTLKYKKTHALSKVNLAGMLAVLGMEFEGREHCGLDDAMNLARIAIRMMEDGAEFRINEKLVAAEYADKYASFVPTISTTGMSTAERDRRKWRLNLPYRIVNICKDRFMTGAYADCDSCDEDANFYEKAANRK